MRVSIPILALSLALPAVASDAPTPPKKDVPYIVHVNNLVELEVAEAIPDESKKKEVRYYIPGASSSAKTPLGFPEFLFAPGDINPELLELYEFEVNNDRREILLRKGKKIRSHPIFLRVMREADGVVRIRVQGSLRPGEYCLTPRGADTAFCFAVT